MKINTFFYGFLTMTFLFISCSKDEILDEAVPESGDLQEEVSSKALKQIGTGVMMQAFYWDVPAGGTWWNVIKGKVSG